MPIKTTKLKHGMELIELRGKLSERGLKRIGFRKYNHSSNSPKYLIGPSDDSASWLFHLELEPFFKLFFLRFESGTTKPICESWAEIVKREFKR